MMFELDTTKIDFVQLKKQKNTLFELIATKSLNPTEKEDIEGLLSFLDYVQDEAAKVIGSENVFGYDS